MNPVKVGDRFRLQDGTLVEVVDRFHKRQTLGYWCNGIPEDTIRLALLRPTEMWFVRDSYSPGFPFPRGALCLCLMVELDGAEENEWGVVMP